MLDFRRGQRNDSWAVHIDYTAVPLTPADVATLVEALHECDRWRALYRPDIGGPNWESSHAETLLNTAGVAAALGHPTVPLLVRELEPYRSVLRDLRKYSPYGGLPTQLEQLLTRLHVLVGMARVHGWTAQHGDAGLQWHRAPAPDQLRAVQQITAGPNAQAHLE